MHVGIRNTHYRRLRNVEEIIKEAKHKTKTKRRKENLLLKDDSSVTSYTSKMPIAPR